MGSEAKRKLCAAVIGTQPRDNVAIIDRTAYPAQEYLGRRFAGRFAKPILDKRPDAIRRAIPALALKDRGP